MMTLADLCIHMVARVAWGTTIPPKVRQKYYSWPALGGDTFFRLPPSEKMGVCQSSPILVENAELRLNANEQVGDTQVRGISQIGGKPLRAFGLTQAYRLGRFSVRAEVGLASVVVKEGCISVYEVTGMNDGGIIRYTITMLSSIPSGYDKVISKLLDVLISSRENRWQGLMYGIAPHPPHSAR